MSKCAHCDCPDVSPHCIGVPERNCPWVNCDECGYVTDHLGRTYLPPPDKRASQ